VERKVGRCSVDEKERHSAGSFVGERLSSRSSDNPLSVKADEPRGLPEAEIVSSCGDSAGRHGVAAYALDTANAERLRDLSEPHT
jgi:hypothetical protein